jgi:hypothetical protein
MKNIFTLSVLLIITLLTVNISLAQNNKFSKPHDFNNDNFVISKTPESPSHGYSQLPYPYINYNLSRDSFPQNEPSVKFNAKYPNKVLAAWRDFRTGVSPALRRIGYTYSTDGGTTWSPSQLIPALDPNHPLASDPVVVSDTNGNFYVCTVSLTTAGALDLLVFKSTDGGATFNNYYFVQGGGANSEDKEWMICDLTKGSSPYKNNLYISWTRFGTPAGILLTKSTNGGVNWSSPVQVSNGGGVQGSDPAIGPNGEVYVVWVGGTATNDIIFFNKSTNGGATFGTVANIAQGLSPNITISSSGVTFPSIDCDLSGGPRNGYLYTVWCDARNGDPDVFLIRSSNGGTNWSTPVRVNDDAVGNGKLQCWPWISVNEQGNIAILYFDSRNSTSTNIIDAWLARSTDGGLTFINERLSSTNFTASSPNSDVRFGDYINVDYSGSRIATVWTDQRAGGINQEIYTAVIDLSTGITPISTKTPDSYSLSQNYPNPFNPTTKIKFDIKKSGFVSLYVYDSRGSLVSELVNGNYNTGSYEVSFEASKLSSGIYFYKLETEEFSNVKKMMLIK